MLTLLPAVDVANGRAVRLLKGQAGTETDYGDPLDAARHWVEAGAQWIHLVDLDAAFGRGSNAELLARIVGEVGVKVELSGGIRDDASLDRALEAGAARINLGTAALEDPEWTERAISDHGDLIAVSLDVRGSTLAARGWTREGGNLWETLERLNAAGCSRYVVTDVTKDGTLSGPNIRLLTGVCRRTRAPSATARACWRVKSPLYRALPIMAESTPWGTRAVRAAMSSRRAMPPEATTGAGLSEATVRSSSILGPVRVPSRVTSVTT